MLLRPSDLMLDEKVKKRFKTAQHIGWFLAIMKDKIKSVKSAPTVFVDEAEFSEFLEYIENYKK